MKNKMKKVSNVVVKLVIFFFLCYLLKISLLKDVGEFGTILANVVIYFCVFSNKTLLETFRGKANKI